MTSPGQVHGSRDNPTGLSYKIKTIDGVLMGQRLSLCAFLPLLKTTPVVFCRTSQLDIHTDCIVTNHVVIQESGSLIFLSHGSSMWSVSGINFLANKQNRGEFKALLLARFSFSTTQYRISCLLGLEAPLVPLQLPNTNPLLQSISLRGLRTLK